MKKIHTNLLNSVKRDLRTLLTQYPDMQVVIKHGKLDIRPNSTSRERYGDLCYQVSASLQDMKAGEVRTFKMPEAFKQRHGLKAVQHWQRYVAGVANHHMGPGNIRTSMTYDGVEAIRIVAY